MKRFLLLPLLAASIAQAQPVQRSFPACGVAVTFSGIPEKTEQGLLDFMASKGFNPKGDSYTYKTVYDGAMTSEFAVCVCPELVIAAGMHNEVNTLRSATLRGIGNAIFLPMRTDEGITRVSRIVSPKATPLCFLQQDAATNRGEAALKPLATGYFDRLLKPLE